MDYFVTIVVAVLGALASFGGAALASRNGFTELKTEFRVKQQETERRIDKLETKIDKIMEERNER